MTGYCPNCRRDKQLVEHETEAERWLGCENCGGELLDKNGRVIKVWHDPLDDV